MQALQMIRALVPIDIHSIRRDPLLRWMAIVPLVVALAARWLLPGLLARLEALAGFSMLAFYPPFMGFALLVLCPMMCGMVIGFLLLDQRDDRTLTALQVTPLSLDGYLAYRLMLPLLVSSGATLIALPLSGLAGLGAGGLIAVGFVAAPLAPLGALALAAYASNKVQGFALTKLAGIFLIVPLLAYFAPAAWHPLLAIAPTYWPARFYWELQAAAPGAWVYAAGGLLYQGALLWLLARRFRRVAAL